MRVSPFGEKSIWLIRSLFSRNTFATRKLRMVLSTSFILSEDKSRHLQSGLVLGSLHDEYMTSLRLDPTRCSTWFKILLKGGNPEATRAPWRQHSCDKFSFSWDDVENELEAFYSPVAVELLFILTVQRRWVFICFPLWQNARIASSGTDLQLFLVWNASHAIRVNKQLSKPPRFIFNLRASFVSFLSLCRNGSSL